MCGLMVTTLIFVISLTAFSDLVVHVNKVDNIDWDIDEGSFEGGADKREVRMDGSLPGGNAESGGGKVEPAPGPTTSGECRGVLSRSFGDNESKLSMPLSFSIDMYDAGGTGPVCLKLLGSVANIELKIGVVDVEQRRLGPRPQRKLFSSLVFVNIFLLLVSSSRSCEEMLLQVVEASS